MVGPSVSTHPVTQEMHPIVVASVYDPTPAYVPEAQLTHAVAGLLSLSCSPNPQSVQLVAAAGEYWPEPQAMQVV